MRKVVCMSTLALLSMCLYSAPLDAQEEASCLSPVALRCAYRDAPLGIDTPTPKLSWQLHAGADAPRGVTQTAYQILAATSAQELGQGTDLLWDSGQVQSTAQLHIPYAGPPLQPGQRVWWKVRVWDNLGAVSEYSAPTWWEMGLLDESNWSAHWIGRPETPIKEEKDWYAERPAPLLRKAFTVNRPIKDARAYVTGLGYYELRLNGEKVGDHELDTAWTAYDKRIFYSVYDITEQVREGENVVGSMLGNGWYNPLPMKMWNRFNLRDALPVGNPCLKAQVEITYDDGSTERIVTDASWRTADGPIVKNSVYLGEVYDARKALPGWDTPNYDARAWDTAVLLDAPEGRLEAQPLPPIRVTDSISPVSVEEVSPGVYIFDAGENLAGRARISVSGPAGTRIALRYGELRYPDGQLNPMTAVWGQIKNREVPKGSEAPATAWQEDVYILRGDGEENFAPRFTFHGFRYIEVTGWPGVPTLDNLVLERLHSDVTPASSFECSNELFNTIQEISLRTLKGNLHGVQSDCPHREKFGYGGDLVADSELGMLNFDMATFYIKTVRDFGDAIRPNGGFTETAPFVGIADKGFGEGSGPIGWGTVHPLFLAQLYLYYGETALIEEQYPAAQRWMALLEEKAQDFIIENGIGDHESLVEKDIGVSGTALFYYNAVQMANLAHILGRDEERDAYRALAEKIMDAFNKRFYNAETGLYGNGSQANQAFALFYGLAPEEEYQKVLDALITDIEKNHNGHLSTGIFGTKYMLHVLSALDRHEVAYRIVNQKDFPGWGHMIENGATTLWEHWEFSDNTYSHNHPMFGTVSEWFMKEIAGIAPAYGRPGFEVFEVQPNIGDGITWAKAQYDSIRGRIVSDWRIEGEQLQMNVAVPVNSYAIIRVPVVENGTITESGAALENAAGISQINRIPGYVIFLAGSGQYRFETAWH